MDVGEIVYQPPRDGPTLWEIGIPDRSAAEFYIPEPNPKYMNKLFINHPERLVVSLHQHSCWKYKKTNLFIKTLSLSSDDYCNFFLNTVTGSMDYGKGMVTYIKMEI